MPFRMLEYRVNTRIKKVRIQQVHESRGGFFNIAQSMGLMWFLL